MADNIDILPSPDVGAVPAKTEEIGGVHYQGIKVFFGPNGTAIQLDDEDDQRLPVDSPSLGLPADAAAATDGESTGLIALFKRLLGKFPASLGAKLTAASLSVTLASDHGDVPITGEVTVSDPVEVSNTVTVTGSVDVDTLPEVDISGAGIFAAVIAVDCGDQDTSDEAIAGAGAGTRLMGFSSKETTGTDQADFNIRNGTSNTDPLLVIVSLGINESAREWYGPEGIAADDGIWLERTNGTTHVIGYYKVVS